MYSGIAYIGGTISLTHLLWYWWHPEISLSDNTSVSNLWVIFLCIKYIYISRSIYINNNYFLWPLLFMIIIHVIVHVMLFSIIIISQVQCASIVNVIDVPLFTFVIMREFSLVQTPSMRIWYRRHSDAALLPPISAQWLWSGCCG